MENHWLDYFIKGEKYVNSWGCSSVIARLREVCHPPPSLSSSSSSSSFWGYLEFSITAATASMTRCLLSWLFTTMWPRCDQSSTIILPVDWSLGIWPDFWEPFNNHFGPSPACEFSDSFIFRIPYRKSTSNHRRHIDRWHLAPGGKADKWRRGWRKHEEEEAARVIDPSDGLLGNERAREKWSTTCPRHVARPSYLLHWSRT